MAIKLNGNLNGLEPNSVGLGSAQKAPKTQSSAISSQQDSSQPAQESQSSVSITSTASVLASAQQSLSAKPAIDQARVAQISKALENGTYKIDSNKIASGLLQSEHHLNPLPRQEI
jgi:negative regulator of flagellin synthesis FlgM